MHFDHGEEVFRLLDHDRIGAYLAGPAIANRAILRKTYPQSGIKEATVTSQFALYPYLHKKHAQLITPFETALRKMTDDGFLDSVRSRLE